MLEIKCPYCGKRSQNEFSYGGDATIKRPELGKEISDKNWDDFVDACQILDSPPLNFVYADKKNNIPYPKFDTASTVDEAVEVSKKLDFPILIRPSYVLGGQGMKIVINEKDLKEHVDDLLRKIPNIKLLLDHYLDGAIEAEADAICDGENVYIIGIMEHIEPCGIHSGDSNA